MIELSKGSAVLGLLDRVAARTGQYVQIVICSPFIDEGLLRTITALAQSAERSGCDLCIVTTRGSADRLVPRLPRSPPRRHTDVVVRPNLHAKLYLALGRQASRSEVIVTSANLTQAGTCGNIELGVRIASTSQSGRHLLQQIHQFVRDLTA